MTRLLTGGCQCGEVRYEIAGAPREVYVCHCLECRKQSASAFGISVMVLGADVRLVKGRARILVARDGFRKCLDLFLLPHLRVTRLAW